MGHNKFRNLYPALWEPKLGDQVRVIKIIDSSGKEVSEWLYKAGDTGTVVMTPINTDGLLAIEFENKRTHFLFKQEIELI